MVLEAEFHDRAATVSPNSCCSWLDKNARRGCTHFQSNIFSSGIWLDNDAFAHFIFRLLLFIGLHHQAEKGYLRNRQGFFFATIYGTIFENSLNHGRYCEKSIWKEVRLFQWTEVPLQFCRLGVPSIADLHSKSMLAVSLTSLLSLWLWEYIACLCVFIWFILCSVLGVAIRRKIISVQVFAVTQNSICYQINYPCYV